MVKRLERAAKEQLKENDEAINALMDKYVASLECFGAMENKNISEANLNIQKILTDIANRDSDEVVSDLYQNLSQIEDANSNLDMLDKIKGILFEEIEERKVVKGLHKKD